MHLRNSALHIDLRHPVLAGLQVLRRRERRDLAGLLVVERPSVTRSRITGKVRSGVVVTVSDSSKVDIRVMHISHGRR
jgi:hypothetical protein